MEAPLPLSKIKSKARRSFNIYIDEKKIYMEYLKKRFQSFSLQIKSKEPLWMLAVKFFLRMNKDRKTAIRNILCLVNYHLNLLVKKYLILTPEYCEDTWKSLNEFWTFVTANVKYTNLLKRNTLTIEQIVAHLIDLNVLTLEISSEATFDIFDRLSYLHEEKQDTDLDILLHCKTLVIPRYRKIDHYIITLRKLFELYANKNYNCGTFLKLCLLARIVLMAADNCECNELLIIICQTLKLPNSCKDKMFGVGNKFTISNLTINEFIKNMDVASIFKSLYSIKKVNLMDDTFDITERQESVKPSKEVSSLTKELCQEKDKPINELRDLFTARCDDTSYGSLRNIRNDKNIENVDPFNKCRHNFSDEAKGKKAAKLVIKNMKSKNNESEISSKESKSTVQNFKNIDTNFVQPLLDVNSPRDLFYIPKMATKDKSVNKMTMMEYNIHTDSNKSSNGKSDQDCESQLLQVKRKSINKQIGKVRKLEYGIPPIGKLKNESKKRKVDIEQIQFTEMGTLMIKKTQLKPCKRKRKRNVKAKNDDAISTSSQSCENQNNIKSVIINESSLAINFKEKQNSKGIEEKNMSNRHKFLNTTLLGKLKSNVDNGTSVLKSKVNTCKSNFSGEGNESIIVQKVEDKNGKIRKPRIKKLKNSNKKENTHTKDDLELGEMESEQTVIPKKNDFWSILTEENQGGSKSRSKNRRKKRTKKFESNECCLEIPKNENPSMPTTIESSTGGIVDTDDSDVEIIEDTQSCNSSMNEFATESEESEIDEASGSEDEIVPNDETNSMFTVEESSVFDKNFKEDTRKSKELDLECKIVQILEKRRQKEINTLVSKILKPDCDENFAGEVKKIKKERTSVNANKKRSNRSSVTIDLVNDSVNSDELKIILTKSKNASYNNTNELMTTSDGIKIIHESAKFNSQMNFGDGNASLNEVSCVTEPIKPSALSEQKVLKSTIPCKTDNLIANGITKSDNCVILQLEKEEISKLNLNLGAEVRSICVEENNGSSISSLSVEGDKCKQYSNITGGFQYKKDSPVKVIDSKHKLSNTRKTGLCDINTEDSISSTSDVGDEAYEAGCSDSSEDNAGKKFGKQSKSNQKRLSSEESSSSLQKRRRQSSSMNIQNEINNFSLFTLDSETSIGLSSNFAKVASPLSESTSLHLEIEVSSDDTSKDNDIVLIKNYAKNDNCMFVKSFVNDEATEDLILIQSESLINSNATSKDLNVAIENIELEPDTITISDNEIPNGENVVEEEVFVTDSTINASRKSITSLKTIASELEQCNIKNSPMSAAVLGTAIESIMNASSYNSFENAKIDCDLSKIEDNKENIENNEQEGEELEVLSTSSIETEEVGLVNNLATPSSKEQANSRSPSSINSRSNASNSAIKGLFSHGKRRKSVQEIKSPNKRNSLVVSSPPFPTPQKVPTSALMGSELIISPGVSDDENEMGKEVNSHIKIIDSLPSVDQPDPWIRSKSPQKITQEEQTDIIDKASICEIIKKSPIKLISKSSNNQLLIEMAAKKSSIKSLSKSPLKFTLSPQIRYVDKPLATSPIKSPLLPKDQLFTSPTKKLRSTPTCFNSKNPSLKSTKSPVKLDKFSESYSMDSDSLGFSLSTKSSRLSLKPTRKSHRISITNVDSISPMKNECESDISSEKNTQKVIAYMPAMPESKECITEIVINNRNDVEKEDTMASNVLYMNSESSVFGRVKSTSSSPTKSSVSPKRSQLATVNESPVEKLEDSVPSDSEDRDKVFSPIKRTTRSSTIAARRLSTSSVSINELNLNSPRRTRRSSITSVTTQDDLLLSAKKLLDSPARVRTRRNSSANTLTPIRRSRRISGIAVDELNEIK